MSKKKFNVLDHYLVPKHEILPDSEINSVLEEYHLSSKDQLPKILRTDPVIKAIGAKVGDVIRIHRKDLTGEYYYYRVVV